MADNYINVTVTSKQNKRVTVSTQDPGYEVTATTDTGKFWAQTAENWATSDTIVENKDYSSKYYANKAKISEENARVYENAVKETYNSLIAESNGISNEIRSTGNEVIDNINSTKTNIIQDIEFVADGEKKEIEDLIDSGKEELKESIGDVKVLATLKIGQIGIAPLGIDETLNLERYLNGQIIIQDQFKGFTNYLKRRVELYPSVACTEEEWQTEVTMSAFSQCGKFVIDDIAGTIRLPKVVNIQGLTDLSKLGEIIEAGLPNITGSLNSSNTKVQGYYREPKGAFQTLNGSRGTFNAGESGSEFYNGLSFDASLSNPIYGNSNTVQQEQIQYPYFIQVATGSETEDNIINEIELNNPFSLLDYKFSEYELNNISWLRSQGQYNSKAIYPAVYNLLLKIYNGTEIKAGVSVKLHTDTSATDYDFRINTAEETFRLPIKVKLASGKAVVGNGMTLGLTDGTNNLGLQAANSSINQALTVYDGNYGKSVGSTQSGTRYGNNKTLGVTTDPTKSGIETSDSDLYLYFYVGETVQNANLINAGRIEEKVAECITRIDCKAYITETYINGTSWYRIWSDGWCEQGGQIDISVSSYSVTYLIPFKDTNYTISNQSLTQASSATTTENNRGATQRGATLSSITETGFASVYGAGSYSWYACGYIR